MAWALAVPATMVAPSVVPSPAGGGARLNELQVIGTHNSYHVEPPPPLADPTFASSRPPLAQQLSTERVRQVELDVWADPAGTLWMPLGTRGFKVFHMEQVDTESTCETFVKCLRQLKGWSDARPGHLPIAVLVEPKDEDEAPAPPDPLPITTPLLDALDAEVRSVLPPRDLITPDDVRGKHRTLEDAVRAGGWPTVASSRGKFMFLLHGRHDEYAVGHRGLKGRVMFSSSLPGQPDAALINIDDPRGANQATIRDLVRQGYVVRTQADEPVLTPQSGDVTRRDAALASGAQWVSTDYPVPGLATRWGSDYVVQLPRGAIARCNPVLRRARCSGHDLTEPFSSPPPDPTTGG